MALHHLPELEYLVDLESLPILKPLLGLELDSSGLSMEGLEV